MKLAFLPGDNCKALPVEHFPAPFQAVIWRNWGMVPVERLAGTLQCTVKALSRAAAELGLTEPDDSHCEVWLERGYQTIIRQNWHLLPVDQILKLLDWTPEHFVYVLKEDDFLWCKLGKCKPETGTVRLRELTYEKRVRTAKLKNIYHNICSRLTVPVALPFDFLTRKASVGAGASTNQAEDKHLRMIYSYSALYGDPLLDGIEKIYPDSLLDEYAAAGVNALWMQAVLYTLIPWFGESELSGDWQTRLANLRKLAQRMAVRGIKLFLYLNEPRAMPETVFERFCPEWRGAAQRMNLYSFCTSRPEVLNALSNAIERLFRQVPELAGFFAVTMSENPTNCWSHTLFAPPTTCPICFERGQAVVISELLTAMAEGAWRAKPDAEVIAWNWGWEPSWDEQVIDNLPDDITLMCVSETGLETDAAGIKGTVWDYSISKVGPGAWARRVWDKARSRGMKIMAKVQLNNSWECSAVPYLPTPGLIEQHLNNLRKIGVNDFLLSWTLGGYPGGNIRLLREKLKDITRRDFGEAADIVMEAYSLFDRGFTNFPFNMTPQIYLAPQNFGPVNQLYLQPTGNKATMLGFPYDDLFSWTGDGYYPEDVFEAQFRKLSNIWLEGMEKLKMAEPLIQADGLEHYNELYSVAEAAYCHFRSTYLQTAFIRRRGQGAAKVKPLLEEEMELAVRLLNVVRRDSRIGFEASNHYYYTENALIEKIFNCQYLLDRMKDKTEKLELPYANKDRSVLVAG